MPGISAIFCVVSPQGLGEVRAAALSPALLSHRLGDGLQLLRADSTSPLPGGLLVLTQGEGAPQGDPAPLAGQLLRECRARKARGILLDWEQLSPPLLRLTQYLCRALIPQGVELWLPEGCGHLSAVARVLISSALSGGTLELRLREALETWGPHRAVLALEKTAADFTLPAFSGQGKPLTQGALEDFLRRQRPRVYWSQELCAQYFTYQVGGQIHFVLYDDGPALLKKLELAAKLGYTAAIAPWQEVRPLAGELRRMTGR